VNELTVALLLLAWLLSSAPMRCMTTGAAPTLGKQAP
jgi:hypothetical protein